MKTCESSKMIFYAYTVLMLIAYIVTYLVFMLHRLNSN